MIEWLIDWMKKANIYWLPFICPVLCEVLSCVLTLIKSKLKSQEQIILLATYSAWTRRKYLTIYGTGTTNTWKQMSAVNPGMVGLTPLTKDQCGTKLRAGEPHWLLITTREGANSTPLHTNQDLGHWEDKFSVQSHIKNKHGTGADTRTSWVLRSCSQHSTDRSYQTTPVLVFLFLRHSFPQGATWLSSNLC
jgi:hypothetical protein